MKSKIELLAPAKDLYKAKIALIYGADAVYLGGLNYSLRKRASNFSLDDIKEICEFAKALNKKVYVTVNIVFHNDDFTGLIEYLKQLEEFGVTGVIMSSVALIKLVKHYTPKLEVHISTQISTCNSSAVNLLEKYGATRVVLARECSLKEISLISKNTACQLEVFIHGGMCSNYSGKCTLSNSMADRDANRGGCAHSCRWKYHIYDKNTLVSDKEVPFCLSSKDLNAIEYVENFVKLGISCLKIEGRMKSEYYLAQVVRTYRRAIDEVYLASRISEDTMKYLKNELKKAENRQFDDGFLSGVCDSNKQLYDVNGSGVRHDYVGLVLDYDPIKSLCLVETKNKFQIGDKLEVFGYDKENTIFECRLIFDEDKNFIEVCNKPASKIYLKIPFEVKKDYMIRKIID